jgi:Transcriptional Coactivator p15 (PC4)
MNAPPDKARAPAGAWGSCKAENSAADTPRYTPTDRRGQASSLTTIATIAKGHAAQLRVSLTSWRAKRQVEVRECTSVIPGTYFPTANGITLDVELLSELVAALQAAEREARKRGLLPSGRAAA